MWAVFKKEVNIFFSSLIGYIAIGVFLIANGLIVWVLPESNVFDFGYATLQELFTIAPWVFMFLIPALTMRFFAEEHQTGTLEFLATKPLTDYQIISGKYLAGLTLVIFSILPTLVYFFTIHELAAPRGNVDFGGTWGSYLGLLFLGSAYVSIGMFASAITNNQIISFILGMFLCFVFYLLLDWIRDFALVGMIDPILEHLSIQTHYQSISRGVLDTRDLVYFVSFNVFFLALTKTVIESRKW